VRTFWQRRLRDPIVAQLTQGITPEKISLTLAIGVALGLFPVIGTTSLLCFFAAIVLRLNQPIIQLINQALWPVHIPVVLGCLVFGERIFGVPKPDRLKLNIPKAYHDFREDFWPSLHVYGNQLYHALAGPTLYHTIVAWSLLVPPCIFVVYFAALPIVRGITRVKAEAAMKKASSHPVP
jgi:hypothetical protein